MKVTISAILALVIIGNTQVELVDEPTASVNAFARHKIWAAMLFLCETYKQASLQNTSLWSFPLPAYNSSLIHIILLISHSMRELETLLRTLIAIIIATSLMYLSSIQPELRLKFGKGCQQSSEKAKSSASNSTVAIYYKIT